MTRAPSLASSWSRRALVAKLGCAVALLLGSCGGEDKGRPSTQVPMVPAVNQCERALAGFTFQTLVDFEQDNACSGDVNAPETRPQVCADAPFYFSYDNFLTVPSPGAVPNPADPNEPPPTCPNPEVGEKNIEAEMLDSAIASIPEGARCRETELSSIHALHVQTKNLATCIRFNGRRGWGSSLELRFNGSFDASDWDGISFWVRRGNPARNPTLLFSVADQWTDSATGSTADHCNCWPAEANKNPRCLNDPSKDVHLPEVFPDNLKCDAFGIAVTLPEEWTFVTAYFSAMRQKGFGWASEVGHVATKKVCLTVPDPGATGGEDGAAGASAGGSTGAGTGTSLVCKGGLTRLQFISIAGDTDFWLDDVSLFKAPK